uniref:Uncharacterized protein n=1 Tax=Bubo bubo TaxID=30461 RepID=A0A8C0IIG3_BUBBB
MSSANLTSSSSWYSVSCCCIWSLMSVISLSFASIIFLNFSRSPAIISSNSRMRSSAALCSVLEMKASLVLLPVSEGQKAGSSELLFSCEPPSTPLELHQQLYHFGQKTVWHSPAGRQILHTSLAFELGILQISVR